MSIMAEFCITFLNLGGLPPFPGFFIKLKFISDLICSPGFLIVFLARSLLIIYIYMGIRFRGLLKTVQDEELRNERKKSVVIATFIQIWAVRIFLMLCVGVIT